MLIRSLRSSDRQRSPELVLEMNNNHVIYGFIPEIPAK